MTRRLAAMAAVTVAVLALLAACGGGKAQPPPTPTPTPKQVFSCKAIQTMTSYRYLLTLKLDAPGFQASDQPFGQFQQVLAGLLKDVQIEGAFQAPDRSQAVLRFQNQEVEVRTIGNQSWVRLGDVWQPETAPTGEMLLSPQTICDEIVPDLRQSLTRIRATAAVVNGVATRRYHLDEADLPGLTGLLNPTEAGQLPDQFSVDVWLAEVGNWPVRLQIVASASDEQGQSMSLELFMEFSHINSPDVQIEPPEAAGGQV